MIALRKWVAATAVLCGAALAFAAGINGNFDALVTALQTARPLVTGASDPAKIDASIAALQAASTDVGAVTASVKALQKVVKTLGPLAADSHIADALKAAVDNIHVYVVGRGASGAAAASQKEHNPLKLLKVSLNYGKQLSKMDAVSNDPAKTLAQRLKVYLKACKSFDKVVKKYGTA